MSCITRFAPSPTGFLHIGSARTALFNWLFARHHGGQMRLRIEDTDRKRSTQPAIDAILDGMAWLGLDWDGEVVYQSARIDRHAQVAQKLLADGKAYYCYCTPEELQEMRDKARAEGRTALYDGRWRDRDPAKAPDGVAPVVRLKAPREGETEIHDQVQGSVTVANQQLDDLVMLRADGTPTYMLSVVVDDHDMGVTHVIRGDDHFTNTFRQAQIFRAAGWSLPVFAHVPLIHGADGRKLSKRHGALGVDAYRDMGYLPEALRNHLLRLGWSHGDDEIISTAEAVSWFDLDGIGRAPARFDFTRLDSLNGHYLRQRDDGELVKLLVPRLQSDLGGVLSDKQRDRLLAGMPGIKQRAKTLKDLADAARFYVVERPLAIDNKAGKLLSEEAREQLGRLHSNLSNLAQWSEQTLEACVKSFAEVEDVKLGQVAQPLRAALSGQVTTPGIFEVMVVLGRDETLARLGDQARAQTGD